MGKRSDLPITPIAYQLNLFNSVELVQSHKTSLVKTGEDWAPFQGKSCPGSEQGSGTSKVQPPLRCCSSQNSQARVSSAGIALARGTRFFG